METIGATEARANFAKLLRRVSDRGARIAIEHRGKPRALLVPADEAAREAPGAARASLRKADALFNETEHLARLGHWEWDEVEDRCTYCSDELARLHGITAEEFLERASSLDADMEWMHPEDRADCRATVDETKRLGKGFEIEYRLLQPGGGWLEVREVSEVALDEAGSVVRSFGFVQDITERKKSEEALRQSDALLKQAMRTTRMGAWVWDDATDECLYCSEELALLFGQSIEEYLATRSRAEGITADIHPDDRDYYRKCIDEAVVAGRWYEVEFRERVASGTYRHFREVGGRIDGEGGGQLTSMGIVQDITESKDVERALRASEAALSRAQRQARIGSWRWDVPGNKLISCSEEFARIHGVPMEEAPGLMSPQMGRVVHPDDLEWVTAEFKRVDQEGIDYDIEYRIVRPDGEVRQVLLIGEMLLDGDGRAVEQTGTVQDITERKRIEEELRRSRDELEERVKTRTAELQESEHRYRTIFDTAAAGIGRTLLEDGRVILSNEKLARMFGYESVEGFVSEFVFSEHYADPEDRARLMSSYQDSPGTPIECTFTKRDDSPVIVQAHAIANSEEGILDFVATDITEQRVAEERLHQAQKMEAVGQLTGGVAHDFNNLLAVIMGNTELLQDRLGRENRPLAAILRAAKRGAELTQRLLAYSRQQPLKPQVIDLGGLVSGMSDMLTRTLGEPIEIEVRAAADLWSALADPGQVENALLNLALNARDVMPGGGKLTIECANALLDEAYVAENPEAKAGDYVVLAVSDEGSGMTAEVLARAFEPFYTTKEVGQGSGLGLSMVYGFAKQSGGHVVISSAKGQGTTVKLYLPRAEEAARSEAASRDKEVPSGRGEVILVIEDDPDVKDLAVLILDGLGYRTLHVPTAAQARKILADEPRVELVLSDVVLPGGASGPQFAEEARTTYPDLKIIFMSGYPADAADRKGFLGPDEVLLSKPFSRHQLAKAVREALG